MKQHKIKETYEFQHNGIVLFVKIDYLNNKISIVRPSDVARSQFSPNSFIFAGRGVEYMAGWRNILGAVSEATKDAQKKYEANLAEESKFKEGKIVAMAYALAEDKPKKKKK